MFKALKPLILASASPRRQEFLHRIGLDFTIRPAEIDETVLPGESADQYVTRMAREKGKFVAESYPDSWIVAADTIVSLGGELLGKPGSEEHAVNMLMMLSGKEHEVRSSFCLVCESVKVFEIETIVTKVTFNAFDRSVAQAYAATREPLDKAGAYGIQGRGIALVSEINGSYSNVVGLPMAELLGLLQCHEVVAAQSQRK